MKVIKKVFVWMSIIGCLVIVTMKLQANKAKIKADIAFAQTITDVIPVKVYHVKSISSEKSTTAIGHLIPQKSIPVLPGAQGIITKLYTSYGDHVKAGQLIAQIENDVLTSQYETALNNLKKTEKDLARIEVLVKNDVATHSELEGLEIKVKKSKTDVKQIEKYLANTTVKAPISGVIFQQDVEEGQLVAGSSVIAMVATTNKFKVEVFVDEQTAIQLTDNDQVKVRFRVYKGEDFTGKINNIAPIASSDGKFKVEVALVDTKNKKLKAGLSSEVHFFTNVSERLQIPREAITGSLKSPRVFIAQEGKSLEKVIEVGLSYDSFVEVIDGLSLGEQVITQGQINLENGTSIRILN